MAYHSMHVRHDLLGWYLTVGFQQLSRGVLQIVEVFRVPLFFRICIGSLLGGRGFGFHLPIGLQFKFFLSVIHAYRHIKGERKIFRKIL